ncbi:TIGR02680 family protein [Allonocardiopsis opalescens]|uniref:Uncharacterized protein (TIGR02680 family) n=1 Tax=Allonocardiopsis opalescens TaxID=1144618 RepID=A0A2T0Q7X0_9ACTN|nr:TIGR02680 family protein [Allonocardiopsis opalescens]PRX99950.1 uncharacterized protein (TIGR02680 family) [Allonocardiopsis opalescens]
MSAATDGAEPAPEPAAARGAAAGGAAPAHRSPHRYRLSRAGIHNVWQYDDQEFQFADGRLLLRGKNGAGKSKALEMLLPFLLDGDARRIDATGTSRTSLRWLMLDGRTSPNVLGYLWVEFGRTDEEGRRHWRTLGAAIKASSSSGETRAHFFVTERRVGQDLILVEQRRPLSLDRLRTTVGQENCYDTAVAFRARVMRELFGLDDPDRYRNLAHLLYRLRRPTIGDRIESGDLVAVLTEALPPIDDEVIDKVARNLDDLEAVRENLARLETTDAALGSFLTAYRGYLRGSLRRRVGLVREQLRGLTALRRVAGDAEREVARCAELEHDAAEAVAQLRRTRDTAEADLATLRASAGYREAEELRSHRAMVAARAQSAGVACAAAELARTAENQAVARLSSDVAAAAEQLAAVRSTLRDTRRELSAAHLADTLLGPVPAVRELILAEPESALVYDTDGWESEIERSAVPGMDARALGGELEKWRSELAGAADTLDQHERAVAALRKSLAGLAGAEERARGLEHEAERHDAQAEHAQTLQRHALERVGEAGHSYAQSVREWAQEVRIEADRQGAGGVVLELEPLLALVELPLDGPGGEQALDRDVPGEVVRTVRELTDPVLAELTARRDTAVGEQRELTAELEDLRQQKAHLAERADAGPAPSRYTQPARTPGTGLPFCHTIEFADTVADADRAGLEAALEASGLLAGWLAADGAVVDPDTQDVLVTPGKLAGGPTLLDVLRPVEVPGSGVSVGQVAAVLTSIGLGRAGPDAAPHSWMGTDGHWRLGVASGRYTKAEAEYIGADARRRTLRRRGDELDRRIEVAEALLAEADERRGDIEARQEQLMSALRTLPIGHDLLSAYATLDSARGLLVTATRQADDARRTAEEARLRATDARRRIDAEAGGLPADADALTELGGALARLRTGVDTLRRDTAQVEKRLDAYADDVQAWEGARRARVEAEDAASGAVAQLTAARRELELLERALEAGERDIVDAEAESHRRRESALVELPAAERGAQQARDDRIRASVRRDIAVAELEAQGARTVEVGAQLRRPLGLPGLAAAASLPDLDEILSAYDSAAQESVRVQLRALETLADEVERRLGDEGDDIGDTAVLNRYEKLREGLAGGFDAAVGEEDGIKRFSLHDDAGGHDVAVVGDRIRQAADQARATVAAREKEAFERFLLGELGEHLSRQVVAARALIAAVNDTLREVKTSHGLGARLSWRLAHDADADIHAAAELLERPASERSRQESGRLRDALRRSIEAQRRLDPSAGYGVHLRAALDYRAWFAFTVYVTDDATPGRERRLSYRTAMSQGEQRVIAYLVLFAAASAHFTSLARQFPYAPRLILLDDAFAKVDEPTHGRLLGLLVRLDLDFVLTSERLWGCFPSVPSLNIYECLRDPAQRGVATLHFTWDGERKRLEGV